MGSSCHMPSDNVNVWTTIMYTFIFIGVSFVMLVKLVLKDEWFIFEGGCFSITLYYERNKQINKIIKILRDLNGIDQHSLLCNGLTLYQMTSNVKTRSLYFQKKFNIINLVAFYSCRYWGTYNLQILPPHSPWHTDYELVR